MNGVIFTKDAEALIPGKSWVSDRRLYWTANKERVVEEGSGAAAFLFACVGGLVSAEDVLKYDIKSRAEMAAINEKEAQEAAKFAAQAGDPFADQKTNEEPSPSSATEEVPVAETVVEEVPVGEPITEEVPVAETVVEEVSVGEPITEEGSILSLPNKPKRK